MRLTIFLLFFTIPNILIQPLSSLLSLLLQLSSPLFATTILSPLYATAILSVSLSLPFQLFLSPLCHCNLISLSLCHFNSSSPLFATAILSQLYATAILYIFIYIYMPLQLFLSPLCHCNLISLSLSATSTLLLPSLPLQFYLLSMPLQLFLSPLCHYNLISSLCHCNLISYLSATTTLLSSLTIQILSPLSNTTTLLSYLYLFFITRGTFFFLKFPFYVLSSALFPPYFLPLVAFVTHVLKTCLPH